MMRSVIVSMSSKSNVSVAVSRRPCDPELIGYPTDHGGVISRPRSGKPACTDAESSLTRSGAARAHSHYFRRLPRYRHRLQVRRKETGPRSEAASTENSSQSVAIENCSNASRPRQARRPDRLPWRQARRPANGRCLLWNSDGLRLPSPSRPVISRTSPGRPRYSWSWHLSQHPGNSLKVGRGRRQ